MPPKVIVKAPASAPSVDSDPEGEPKRRPVKHHPELSLEERQSFVHFSPDVGQIPRGSTHVGAGASPSSQPRTTLVKHADASHEERHQVLWPHHDVVSHLEASQPSTPRTSILKHSKLPEEPLQSYGVTYDLQASLKPRSSILKHSKNAEEAYQRYDTNGNKHSRPRGSILKHSSSHEPEQPQPNKTIPSSDASHRTKPRSSILRFSKSFEDHVHFHEGGLEASQSSILKSAKGRPSQPHDPVLSDSEKPLRPRTSILKFSQSQKKPSQPPEDVGQPRTSILKHPHTGQEPPRPRDRVVGMLPLDQSGETNANAEETSGWIEETGPVINHQTSSTTLDHFYGRANGIMIGACCIPVTHLLSSDPLVN